MLNSNRPIASIGARTLQRVPGLSTVLGRTVVLVLFALFMHASAHATTCAAATVLNPASLPITNQALACGVANDLNSTNVPGALCGSGATTLYKNGLEALYSLTPTVTGPLTVSLTGQAWSSVQVWAGCPNTGGTCLYGNGSAATTVSVTVTLTAGVQYFIWFDTWPAPNSPCPGTFSITPPPPPPANDEPCGATLLPVNTTCVNTNGTTVNATGSTGPPAPTCAFYGGSDVWYRVVVPASGNLIIETSPGVVTDGGMALYTAPSCSGPFVQEACDDDSGTGLMPALSFTGLAPGSTVYIRFWEYGGDNNGTFAICVRTPPPPPSGDCVYVLNLFDSFGDGWGTSNVGYRINGGPWNYYTVGGSANQVLIGVNINDVIELTYDASGTFQGENSYSLGLNGGGVYFNSGSPPTAGISFGQLVDCAPPPAAPQDCNGGFTICNGQSFNNNSSNTGNIVDLNTSNQGCLSSGERQGTWYYFSPSSSGTIGFTISPTVVTDYDFAVWGPMSSVNCPPPGAPLRCSYAAPTGDTGAGNGATDLTEGAGGDRWVAPLIVTTGQIYILYVDNFSSNGQSFNLSWQLSGGASLDCTLLPVELVNLTAVPLVDLVSLEWTTLSESNSDHFLVERSRDGIEFHPIGSLDASGTSSVAVDYTFKDLVPMNGVNYYRVVMVDMDGSQLLSPTVTAFIGDHDRPVVAPNPVGDLAFVTLPKSVDGVVVLHVIDASGRLVHSNSVNTSNSKRIELPLVGLDHGLYSLLITDRSGSPLGNTVFVK